MEYEIKPREKFSLGISELWQYRELFYFFTWRDIKIKYKQTFIGFAWAILQPLLMMIILSLVFSRFIDRPASAIPYPIYLFSGLLLWNIFSSGLSSAGNSMVSNANIIKKIYFPRLIIPISSVLVALFDFFIAFLLFIGLLLYYHISIKLPVFILFAPASLFITCLSTFGAGALLAALNVKYRDFRYIIPFMIQALFFISPVIYPLTEIKPDWVSYIVALNPMYSAIELFRGAFVPGTIHPVLVCISLVSSLCMFIAGLYYFRRTESYFADLA